MRRVIMLLYIAGSHLLLATSRASEHGHRHGSGCDKKLDKFCPGWRLPNNEEKCVACVKKEFPHLKPNCTEKKLKGKCAPGPTPLPPRPQPPSSTQPNIVLILTDDQDLELGSMNAMSFTSALGRKGANLTTFFAHTPVCCPSRSELLAGRYFHNLKNDGWDPAGCMHINVSTGTPTGDAPAFATALKNAGYATGLFGKHYNNGGMEKICPPPHGDGSLLVPEGWVEYLGACPDTCYVNCSYNYNGHAAQFKDPNFPNGSNYGTSVIGNASVAFIKRAMEANYPFMIYVATHAPHGPATPAPWYKNLYSDPSVIAPRTPSFGVHSPDKHWLVATQPTLTHAYIEDKIDKFYKNRLRSLRSVDDIVASLYREVEAGGALNRTYWFFTSDHGLHMGQFNLGPCKRNPYETDIRIPMVVVGPDIPPGFVSAVAGLVDLAPTFLDLAGEVHAIQTMRMDGRSLVPLLTGAGVHTIDGAPKGWRDSYLIEYTATSGVVTKPPGDHHLKDNSNNTFIGLRIVNATHNLAYFEFTDAVTDWDRVDPPECEMYDVAADPNQLKNICHTTSPDVKAALHKQLWKQITCMGTECH